MARQRHKEFEKISPSGKEFIKLWNKGDRDGLQIKLAERFNISISTVYHIRKKLGLPDIHSKEHPGRTKLIKRIKKLYYNERSTIQIGKILRLSPYSIQKILHKTSIDMKPKYCVNPLYFKIKNYDGPISKLLDQIKNMYEVDKLSAAQIAKNLGIDQSTVSTKLRYMGIKLRQNHNQVLEGGYPCQWCNTIMEKVYQNKGIRKQRYCNSKCSNRAKDYRRMVNGKRGSISRLQEFDNFLKKSWGDDYEKAVKKILSAKSIKVKK